MKSGWRRNTHSRDFFRYPLVVFSPSPFGHSIPVACPRRGVGCPGSSLGICRADRSDDSGAGRRSPNENEMATTPSLFPDPTREIFFDIETLRLSHEVEGGWSSIARFGLAVAVTWDARNAYRRWFEPNAGALIRELSEFDRIVSFNGDRFDFEVLSAYQPVNHLSQKSFDLLVDLHRRLGHRVKLDDLARDTLGYRKTGEGVEVVQWWREGRKEEVCKYCENDVKLLVDLVEFARKNKYVVIKSRKLSVDWP